MARESHQGHAMAAAFLHRPAQIDQGCFGAIKPAGLFGPHAAADVQNHRYIPSGSNGLVPITPPLRAGNSDD